MIQFTREQQLDILEKALAARKRGDWKDANYWSQKIPLAPHLAMALKVTVGKNELLKMGYILTEAEKEYGQNWLDK